MQLETQFPNELRSLIDWNPVPKLGISISFCLLFALPEYPNRSIGSRGLSQLRIVRRARLRSDLTSSHSWKGSTRRHSERLPQPTAVLAMIVSRQPSAERLNRRERRRPAAERCRERGRERPSAEYVDAPSARYREQAFGLSS
jgi:hypothetical protein